MGKLIDLKKAAAVLLTSVTLMSAAAALPWTKHRFFRRRR